MLQKLIAALGLLIGFPIALIGFLIVAYRGDSNSGDPYIFLNGSRTKIDADLVGFPLLVTGALLVAGSLWWLRHSRIR